MWRIVIWVVIVVAAGLLVFYAVRPRSLAVDVDTCREGDVEAFVAEEAQTRLDDEYVVGMPVAGRFLPVAVGAPASGGSASPGPPGGPARLKAGDEVRSGEVIGRVDTFERLERLKTVEARVKEVQAQILGVDAAKPKPEDIRAAELAVQEARIGLEAARKAQETARINYDEEEKQYGRLAALHKEGTISDAEFDEARRQYLTLKSQYEEACLRGDAAAKALEQADVKLARLRASVDDNEYQRAAFQAQIRQIEADMAVVRDEVARSEIRAPVSGPILEVYQDSVNVLPAGAPLFKIGDLASIRVECDILSEEIGRVRKGQEVEILGPAVGEEPILGTVERIYPAGFKKISSLGIEEQRVKVIVAFGGVTATRPGPNTAPRLRPGVRVDVRIITARKRGVLLVPDEALFKRMTRREESASSDAASRKGWHVFVVREGRAVLRPVSVGLRNDDFAEITAGLERGETVVLNPPTELSDGARVAPRPRSESGVGDGASGISEEGASAPQ